MIKRFVAAVVVMVVFSLNGSATGTPTPTPVSVLPDLQNEKNTYTKWGWTWAQSIEPNFSGDPSYTSVTLIRSCSMVRSSAIIFPRSLLSSGATHGHGRLASRRARHRRLEGRNTGDLRSDNQAVNVVRAFVCVDRLDIQHVADYRVVVDDSVCA